MFHDTFMRRARCCALLSGLFLLGPVSDSEAVEANAVILAAPCMACHGAEGNSVGPFMPSLAGMNFDFLLTAMLEYKRDERKGTVMNRVAKGYTEDEIEAMAEYFEAQTFEPAKQDFDAKLAALGKDLHKAYCQEKCHERGGDASDDSGVLAGQWVGYLSATLADMREGRSTYPPKMKAKVDRMVEEKGEAAFQALLNYYASQQ